MKVGNLWGLSAALVATAIASAPAAATEGYFLNGYGAVNKSMAGAGVAAGFDAMSQATNPATLALVDTQFSADITIMRPDRSYQVTGDPSGGVCPSGDPCFGLTAGSFGSARDNFYLPSISNAWEIDDSSSWGWAIYMSGRMNSSWDAPAAGLFGAGPAGLDLRQGFLQFTYAQEMSPGVYIGVSPILALQTMKVRGLEGLANYSTNPNLLTGNGFDISWGYGGKLGVQADIGAGFTFGAAYQSEIFMSDLDQYAGLFASGGDFNIPATVQIGFAWQAESGFLVALDYKRIFYGDIDSLATSFSTLNTGSTPPILLGSAGGPGFGWEDMDIGKLGIEVPIGSSVRLRAGAAMNTQQVQNSEVFLNTLMPAVQDRHYSAGMTVQIGEHHAINIGGMYSPSTSVSGPNPLELTDQQTIKLEASQWEATLGWTWTF